MGEARIITMTKINYDGLFDSKELYRLIDEFFETKGYDKAEPQHSEAVTPEGKDITVWYVPYKKVSDYFKFIIKMKVFMRNLTDVETEVDGKRKKLKKGSVEINVRAVLESDYEGRWEQKASYYLIRTVFDKILYKKQTADFEAELKQHTSDIVGRMQSFLNLHTYKSGQP